ncbi:hypothetical protein HYS95_01805 [Candidatus Daviesbacteria bacterium]|nr:hypothetical protein [Candidatus Daviesbacteria bacterium]
MRSVETTIHGMSVMRYELCLPDDFEEERASSEPFFVPDKTQFTTPEAITKNLQIIRAAQKANDQIEYGLVRVKSEGKTFILAKELTPLKGTSNGFCYDVYPKQRYDNYVFSGQVVPIEIMDFIHSHTLNTNYDPAISNLFSPSDIKEMGGKYGQRYWVIGPDGSAICLINENPQVFGDEFLTPANKYQKIFDVAGLTYPEALRAFEECIHNCQLRPYYSQDLRIFHQR